MSSIGSPWKTPSATSRSYSVRFQRLSVSGACAMGPTLAGQGRTVNVVGAIHAGSLLAPDVSRVGNDAVHARLHHLVPEAEEELGLPRAQLVQAAERRRFPHLLQAEPLHALFRGIVGGVVEVDVEGLGLFELLDPCGRVGPHHVPSRAHVAEEARPRLVEEGRVTPDEALAEP